MEVATEISCENETTTADLQQTSKIAYVMTELHEFLKQVLARLQAQTLVKCCRVCKRWKSVASFILKTRVDLTWAQYNFHIHPAGKEEDMHSTTAYSLGYFGMDLEKCLQETWSIPRFGLLLCEFEDANEFHGPSHQNDIDSTNICHCLSSVLPSKCELVAVTVPGTVCTTRDLNNFAESEGEGGAAIILFPHMEGVEITRSSIHSHQGSIWEQTGIERHRDVKCVLTFGTTARSSKRLVGQKLQEAFYKDGQTPVIAGAVVNTVIGDNPGKTECIIFSGPRVRAASVLISHSVNTEEGVHKELMQLKHSGLPERHSIGLMFACIGRGSEHFSAWDVESKIFRRIFPNTPLFGLFGNGEIGCTNLPQSKWVRIPKMNHGYTTIMCLISFG